MTAIEIRDGWSITVEEDNLMHCWVDLSHCVHKDSPSELRAR